MESYLWRLGGILLFLAAVAYILIRHGRAQEQAKLNKVSTDAAIRVLQNTKSTDEVVKEMTDDELDKNI